MIDRSRIKFFSVVSYNKPYTDPQSGKHHPKDFYDRDGETKEVLHTLGVGRVRTVVIMGERRSGKSSMIRHMAVALRSFATPIGLVEIPWAGITSREELVTEILHAVSSHVAAQPKAGLMNEDVADLSETEMAVDNPIKALRALLARVPDQRLVVAIDEFDSILVDAPDPEAIISLLGEITGDESLDIRLLLTVARLPVQLVTPGAAPSLADAVITLRPFPKTDLDEMILDITGDEHLVTVEDLQQIYELSGGWPYYAKLLLEGMAARPPGPDQVRLALEMALDNESATERIINVYDVHFSDEEKQLVLLLAENDGRMIMAQLTEVAVGLGAAAQQLIRRGYVREDSGGVLRFAVGFLGPWLRNWVRYDLEVDRHIADLLTQRPANAARLARVGTAAA